MQLSYFRSNGLRVLHCNRQNQVALALATEQLLQVCSQRFDTDVLPVVRHTTLLMGWRQAEGSETQVSRLPLLGPRYLIHADDLVAALSALCELVSKLKLEPKGVPINELWIALTEAIEGKQNA